MKLVNPELKFIRMDLYIYILVLGNTFIFRSLFIYLYSDKYIQTHLNINIHIHELFSFLNSC
jgi:hypothetical protein